MLKITNPTKARQKETLNVVPIPQASATAPKTMGLTIPLTLENVEKIPMEAPSIPSGATSVTYMFAEVRYTP